MANQHTDKETVAMKVSLSNNDLIEAGYLFMNS